MGKPQQSGYNSHYVAVKRDGEVASLDLLKDPEANIFDEIVISQESQITPVYMITLTYKNASKKLRLWDRASMGEGDFRDRQQRTVSSVSLEGVDDKYIPLLDMQ
jgi:hypothetical protein